MSVAISVDIVSDDASPALEALQDVLGPEVLHQAIADSAEIVVRRHLLANGTNKRGWPSTGFWGEAERKTTARFDDEAATISINKIGVRQRYHGGPILPVNTRALTIPISRESYGKTASDFPDAFLLKTEDKAFIAQRIPATRAKSALQFLFLLSKGVDQKPDPSVIPDDETLTQDAMDAVSRAVEEALK